jgi:HlyD family secretion protein
MTRKALTIAGAVAAVAVVSIVLLVTLRNGADDKRTLRTARVERGDIVVKVTESGEVAPLTVVSVKSEMAGEVKRLFVEEGDSVRAGDRLALVQQEASQTQKIAQARASVENAGLNLEEAKRDLDRQQDLYEKGFIARKDVEDAEKQYRQSQIQYELAEKQLWVELGGEDEPAEAGDIGAKTFDNRTVTAPISGVVINLDVEQGEMITSGTQAYGGGGTVLMTIADLSKMIVSTDVNEVDVGKIEVGQSAQIGFDAIRDRVYRGTVKKISPAGTLDGNVVVFPIEVEILGSVSGEFQASAPRTRGRFPGGFPPSGPPEGLPDEVRERIQELRASGAGREEIRSVIEKAMAEHGTAPAPEGRPGPRSESPSIDEVDQGGIALIKPGMTADLDIIIAEAQDVLYVPKEAVIEQDGGDAVLVLEGEETVLRQVITGIDNDVNMEIRQGLKEGDEVVIDGSQTSLGLGTQSSEQREGPPRGGPPM